MHNISSNIDGTSSTDSHFLSSRGTYNYSYPFTLHMDRPSYNPDSFYQESYNNRDTNIQRCSGTHRNYHSFDSQSEPASSSSIESGDDGKCFAYNDDYDYVNNRTSFPPTNHSREIKTTTSHFLRCQFCSIKKGFEFYRHRQTEILKGLFSRWSDVAYHHPYLVSHKITDINIHIATSPTQ